MRALWNRKKLWQISFTVSQSPRWLLYLLSNKLSKPWIYSVDYHRGLRKPPEYARNMQTPIQDGIFLGHIAGEKITSSSFQTLTIKYFWDEQKIVEREEYNPPAASLMQNMSSAWLLTATLQPLYGSLQGAHCKQWHFTAAPAAFWKSCRHWSSCYWRLFLKMFCSPPSPPQYWTWMGLVLVIGDGKRVVARRTRAGG